MAKALDIGELNRLYQEADGADSELYPEQRSNVLLASGDHYTKRGSRFWRRIRDTKDLSSEVKLRLTKNHLSKICKTYVNNITSHAPGVGVKPKNDTELQDQKAAELHNSVWQHIRQRHKLKKREREHADDFIVIGETFQKIFWDAGAGDLIGYEQEVDESGNPLFKNPNTGQTSVQAQEVTYDQFGQPKATPNEPIESDKPVFTGDIVYERHFGFNIFRDPNAKSMDEASFIGIRKMVSISDLKKMVGNDEDKLKLVNASADDTYTIFDGSKGNYTQTKDQTMVREFYFRKCADYPNGYYYICAPDGILFEGELPLGIFPIVYCGFDEIATSPRARSIIKQLRPYQAEVNRAASKIAEHQITLGDDKIMVQKGTTLSHGGQLPGIRGVNYTGMPPTILPGRDGSQYLAYMQSQIKEMYEISNVAEDTEERQNEQDPYTMLFRSMRNKKKFSLYAEKFEQFLVDGCETSLKLYKAYAPDTLVIPAIGKREIVNMPEFKKADDLGYQIKLEPQLDDVETKLGRQLTMNTIIQYVGQKLERDDIGKLIRLSPYGNKDQAWDDFTIDYDNATNDVLALDRGEYRPAVRGDNHNYVLKRLSKRIKQADFRYLPPQVQQMYEQKKTEHEDYERKLQEEIIAAKSGYIPTGGYSVACDFYVPVDPKEPNKTRRVRLPSEALTWLLKRLEAQGSVLDSALGLPQDIQADIAGKLTGPETLTSQTAINNLATGPQSSAMMPQGGLTYAN